MRGPCTYAGGRHCSGVSVAGNSLGRLTSMSMLKNEHSQGARSDGSGGRCSVSLHNVRVTFGRHIAVDGVTGLFHPGSLTAIAGPNGAGKSTLLRSIAGIVPVSGGKVDLGGAERSTIGYLPQVADIDRSFPMTVSDAVLMGAWRRLGPVRGACETLHSEMRSALASVGMQGRMDTTIGSLSSGQLQRVLFARLLMQNASLLLLDEPFNAVDAGTTADLLQLINVWHQEGRTVVAVLHDVEQIRRYFPQTLLLARQPIAWGKTQDVLSDANIRHARVLVNGQPSLDSAELL
ncbi:Manganese transport system ATP-binding protein [Granulibacter bethesdensis CGDNIH1]|uniref:Manganese transport system ATP-binding protein n=2 Tax=Granulibacter bethesdensis TaxID=364410 RepID=Q0BSU4_GRABC|nr:Manganese transport system ATP-binding protein [Granulibacter bethesdensis CGDNIH1]APH51933.1 Manganese transport system ATP-binding protein [Granulibacter bethesdensis]APH64623.1 Manganese transport system ATP-binding protein [Granulibacter bethesdensis]